MITNADVIDDIKLEKAKKIITNLQHELLEYIERGYGPFLAAIYQGDKLIAKCANTVVMDDCSNHHAEINAIRAAQSELKTYDLSSKNLDLYITAEPCVMCVGAIMWSGIKNIYYGVSTSQVEKITGFYEGFKPNWIQEFKKLGICVYGDIESALGEKVLQQYVDAQNIIYKPSR